MSRRGLASTWLFAVGCLACNMSGCTSSPEVAPAEAKLEDPFLVFDEIGALCTEELERSAYASIVVERIIAELEAGSEREERVQINEHATLSLNVNIVGLVESMKFETVSSEWYREAIRSAFERARPFPRVEGLLRECLAQMPLYVYVIWKRGMHCVERPEFHAYQAVLERKLYPILYSDRFANGPGRGFVRVSIEIDDSGRASNVTIDGRPEPAAREKLLRAIDAATPFPPPPSEIYEDCFAREPAVLRLEVQGTN